MAHDPYYELVPQPKDAPFDAAKTALLIIDLQYLDAHKDGWMGRLCRDQGKPSHLNERWDFVNEILPGVRKLQDACRAGGVELIHIRVKYLTPDCRDGQRSLQQEAKARYSSPKDDEFLPEIAPMGDELTINKTSAGTFNSTPIDQVLRNMGIDRLWGHWYRHRRVRGDDSTRCCRPRFLCDTCARCLRLFDTGSACRRLATHVGRRINQTAYGRGAFCADRRGKDTNHRLTHGVKVGIHSCQPRTKLEVQRRPRDFEF